MLEGKAHGPVEVGVGVDRKAANDWDSGQSRRRSLLV